MLAWQQFYVITLSLLQINLNIFADIQDRFMEQSYCFQGYHIGCKEAMILCQFCIQPTASPTMLSGNGRNKGLYQNWILNCWGETNCFCFIPFDLVKIYVSKQSKNLFREEWYIFRVKGGCVKIVTTDDNAIYIVRVCK